MTFEITIRQHHEGSRALHGWIHRISDETGEDVETFVLPSVPMNEGSRKDRDEKREKYLRLCMAELFQKMLHISMTEGLAPAVEQEVKPLSDQIRGIWETETQGEA